MEKPNKKDFGYDEKTQEWSTFNKDSYFLTCITYRRLEGIPESEGNLQHVRDILEKRKGIETPKPISRPNSEDYGDIRNDHANFRLEEYIEALRAFYRQYFNK